MFLCLNSNNLSIAEHKQFMEDAIEANPDFDWYVVAFHHSTYSVALHVTESDIETLRNGLSPVLAKLGIDVVLMGHDHVYARSYIMGGESGMEADIQKDADGNALSYAVNPDGVQYVTLNSGSGSKFYNITQEAFEYTAVQNQEKTPNYSNLEFTEDAFNITTYRTTDNSVVDTFSIYKTSEYDSYVKGYEDGTFRPESNFTRAEAATLF